MSTIILPIEKERREKENVNCESCESYKESEDEKLRKYNYIHCKTKVTLVHRLEARDCCYYMPRREIK